MEHDQINAERFYEMISDKHEPYLDKIPQGFDEPWATETITQVEESMSGYTVTMKSSCFHIPRLRVDQEAPKIGDSVSFYGKGFGYTVHGVKINNQVIFWRDEKFTQMRERRAREDYDAKQERHRANFIPDLSMLHKFTVQEGKEKEWQELVAKNSSHFYEYGIVCFASQWAASLEGLLEQYPETKLLDIVAQACNNIAREMEATGNMVGTAARLVAHFWKHGEKFRLAHNRSLCRCEEDAEEANAQPGSVINPAMFTLKKTRKSGEHTDDA